MYTSLLDISVGLSKLCDDIVTSPHYPPYRAKMPATTTSIGGRKILTIQPLCKSAIGARSYVKY